MLTKICLIYFIILKANALFLESNNEEEPCNSVKSKAIDNLSKCELLKRISFLEIFIENFIKTNNFKNKHKILNELRKYEIPKNSIIKRKNNFIR